MPEPSVAASLDAINKRAMDVYWKSKDLNAAVALLLDGIARGQLAAKDKPAEATQILSAVKAMAFNLASFTWPGWDEQGITISAEQLAAGRHAAELNYRLALELNRPADKVAMAHWMVGAHALAAGEHDEALRQFTMYREKATDDANRYLADGYAAITTLAARRDGATAYEQAIARLNALESQDGKFFAQQLQTARKVFLKSS
jgi:hypothetical protein